MVSVIKAGSRFGKLTVLKRTEKRHGREKPRWLCRCDCGNEKVIWASNLNNGSTKSCGCLHKESVALPLGVAAFNKMVYHMKHNASTRGLDWQLTKEQVRRLTKQPCHYCGTEPSNVSSQERMNGVYIYNGLDRIDNVKGYTIDNVVPCCKICNGAKSKMTVKEFESWLVRAYEHLMERVEK